MSGYNQTLMKKEYQNLYKKQKKDNLTLLRNKIAQKNLSSFAKEIGISKGCLSEIENGDRDLSIGNIHSYKTYFNKNYNLNISVDFLLGYTDVMENQSMDIANDLGLSNDSINVLKEMSEAEHDTLNKLAAEDGLLRLLLLELWNYANNSTFVDITISDHITGNIKQITDKKEIENLMKYQATDVFNMVLYFIKKAFSDPVMQSMNNKLTLLNAKMESYELKEQLKNYEKT